MSTNTPSLSDIFATLNNSGAHACYCERSTDGGCKCALKDEYLIEAEAAINQYIHQELVAAKREGVIYGLSQLTHYADIPRSVKAKVTGRINELKKGQL